MSKAKLSNEFLFITCLMSSVFRSEICWKCHLRSSEVGCELDQPSTGDGQKNICVYFRRLYKKVGARNLFVTNDLVCCVTSVECVLDCLKLRIGDSGGGGAVAWCQAGHAPPLS